MFDRTDVLWREEPTPEPAHTPARDDAPTDDQARPVTRRPRQVNHPRSPDPDPDDHHTVDGEDRAHRPTEADRDRQAREQHRGWQGREAREGPPRADTPEDRAEAYTRRHDSPEDAARDEQSRTAHRAGLDTQDLAREARAAQERDQLAAERQARISEARARLDAAAGTPRTTAPVPDDRDQDRQARADVRAWTDQDRGGIQRVTKDTPAPREPRPDRASSARRSPAPMATDASTTRARRSPATGAPARTATAMPSPTWGCIAPCRTRTYPSSSTTGIRTPRGVPSRAWCAPG